MAAETDDVKVVEMVLAEHTPRAGVMGSPNHWAYRGDWVIGSPEKRIPAPGETPGHWFAHCDGDGRVGERGCGWDSAPTTYDTRDEARAAALRHVAEKIVEAL